MKKDINDIIASCNRLKEMQIRGDVAREVYRNIDWNLVYQLEENLRWIKQNIIDIEE